MNDVCVADHARAFVGLELPNEMPGQRKVSALCRLRGGLGIAVLSHVAHSETAQQAHVRRRKRLCHGDERNLARVAPGGLARDRDPATDGREALPELGQPARDVFGPVRRSHTMTIEPAWRSQASAAGCYFRKSGTSRSSSSSNTTERRRVVAASNMRAAVAGSAWDCDAAGLVKPWSADEAPAPLPEPSASCPEASPPNSRADGSVSLAAMRPGSAPPAPESA